MANKDVRVGTPRPGRIIPLLVPAHISIPGTAPATSGNFGLFFTADAAYELVSVTERHETAGTNGSAVTLMLTKVPSGTAKGSGTDMLSAGIDLKGTADTNAAGALHATAANLKLAAGDSLALVPTGTLTALAGVHVTAWLKRI